MRKYKLLSSLFLIIVLATSVASMLDLNVQAVYRLPFINVRWIDITILLIIVLYFEKVLVNAKAFNKTKILLSLCFLYLFYNVFQLIKSWNTIDLNSQISHFLCTLGFFIIIDLTTFQITTEKISEFVRKFALFSAFTLIFTNFFTLYAFLSGNTILVDSGIRVGLDVEGQKESVYREVIIGLVYLFSLYFIQNKCTLWEKAIFLTALLSIFVSLVYSFGRGLLFIIVSATFMYIIVFSKNMSKAITQIFILCISLFLFYVLFSKDLKQMGYDPVEKITEIVNFTFDFDNPKWDKGRSIPRAFALNAWRQKIWTGFGYDDLYNQGLPYDIATAHNIIITSLFHNGILGTILYLLILIILYKNAIKLWFLLNRINDNNRDILKMFIISSFFWIVPAWTQEGFWEKHSLMIQFMYLGMITNYYMQLKGRTETS